VAVAVMERDRVDSDGNGRIDVDDVRAGKDPNPPSDCDETIAEYGCVGRVAPGGSGPVPAALLVFAIVTAAALRRRSRFFGSHAIIVLAVIGAGLSACASGAALA